jgi:hypothetical protein
MRHASQTDTGDTLVKSVFPVLCVNCLRCPHRIILKAHQLGAHEGDTRRLYRLPLICRCGSKDIQTFLLESADEEAAFLAGATPQRDGGHNSTMRSAD